MKSPRKPGERSGNILNEMDLVVLGTITNSNKNLGVGDLEKILKLTHKMLKKHIDHLTKIGLLSKCEAQKHGKIPLKVTSKGKEILKIFKK
jgi:DNA-binding MarR family transcriptional regulator